MTSLFRILPLASLVAACSSGSSATPLGPGSGPPELVLCQARIDDPHRSGRILLRTAQGLGTERVGDRSGVESGVRIHPDGLYAVFARERRRDEPESRELFVSAIDNSEAEVRLTVNGDIDDEPCWSPDGERILFSTTRGGDRRLWTTDRSGNAAAFLDLQAGDDRNPDWCRATDRIVFSRLEGNGPWRLFLVQGNGTGLVPLTDGGGVPGAELGDREATFSGDGSRVLFVRHLGADRSQLMEADVTTGAVTSLLEPDGEVRHPRFSPHGDRLFCTLSLPSAGLPGQRLYTLGIDGADPLLLIPDERYRYDGFDPLPGLPATPALEPDSRPVDLDAAEIGIVAGRPVLGDRSLMDRADGASLILAAGTFNQRNVAGLLLTLPLPVAEPTDIAVIRIEVVAALSRTDGDSVLRLSVYNPLENRSDTVLELEPPDSELQTLRFSTVSLAHVSREKTMRLEVIGDLPEGDLAELAIDLVSVELIALEGSEER